jgi:ferredoxin
MSKTKPNQKRWLISQAELDAWLDGLAREQTLVAPRMVSGVVLYRPVAGSGEIAWGIARPTMSLKEVFFPSTEHMLSIGKKGTEIRVEATLPGNEPVVIFGVRPCDARGVRRQDAIFLDTPPADAYYAVRRANTTLIGLACKELGPYCFCTSVGGAPDDPEGMDVMLYPVEAGYLVEAVSDKGQTMLQDTGWRESKAIPKVSAEPGPMPLPERSKMAEMFNDEFWGIMAERCLSCRACSYVCPTCRCFAVRDEMVKPGEFERIRCWDACAGENYRRVAGGHRPRPEKGERLRNRYFCKFYYYPEQYGGGVSLACTGCGRCIEVCPAGVDITEVLAYLEKPA